MVEAISSVGGTPEVLWHGDPTVKGVDAVVVPGGFAHGDYLRPGAIARFSPVMGAVAEMARSGGPVVGVCNGFQVLTEAGLLPGALQKNRGLQVPVHDGGAQGGAHHDAVDQRARGGRHGANPDQPLRGQLHVRPRDARRVERRRSRRAALRRQPQRLGRRHRRHLFVGGATSSGSCRTRSGRRARCWAATTACRCCGRWWADRRAPVAGLARPGSARPADARRLERGRRHPSSRQAL